MKLVAHVAAVSLIGTTLCPAIAVESPFLHESTARTAFVGGAYKTCFEKNRSSGRLSDPELGTYCLCYGRALAESVTSSEYEQLILNRRAPATFEQKVKLADTLCTERLRPESRSTPREREFARATSRCMEKYHPEDTDYAGVEVRERFCTCFSSRLVDLIYRSGQPSEQAVKKLAEECS
jgi:hypothetical protein